MDVTQQKLILYGQAIEELKEIANRGMIDSEVSAFYVIERINWLGKQLTDLSQGRPIQCST